MCKKTERISMTTRTYEYNGKTYTTAEIAEELGVKKKTMEKRLRLNNYDLSKCLVKPKSHKLKDLTGEKFNRWTVDSRADSDASGNTMWNCICECGNKATVAGGSLTAKTSQSCGCYNDEKNLVHGHAKKSGSRSWQGVRCE